MVRGSLSRRSRRGDSFKQPAVSDKVLIHNEELKLHLQLSVLLTFRRTLAPYISLFTAIEIMKVRLTVRQNGD